MIPSIVNGFIKSYGAGKTIKIYESSMVRKNRCVFFLIRENLERKLVIICPQDSFRFLRSFSFEEHGIFNYGFKKLNYIICPCDSKNASIIREFFPYTHPRAIGLRAAIGLGDRLGLATPGHIRAVKQFNVFPVLAQQSAREMERTGRRPQDVLDDVTWAVFQEGYRGGFAADADHLKTEEDLYEAFKAGFTMYTIDPSDYIEADDHSAEGLKRKFESLPWSEMECSKERFLKIYMRKRLVLRMPNGKDKELKFSEDDLFKAAVKFSLAIIFTTRMYRRLRKLFRRKRFDFEVSIDEIEQPTTSLEHFFLISELKRFGVRVHGLALRFVGRFEKAVDYIGDLKEFENSFIEHLLISKQCGPYKISVHSGSDKFSIYPILGKLASNMIHLKTSGTSYLESLRLIAKHDPKLFKDILRHSLEHFWKDRKSYHVNADPTLIPNLDDISDQDLERTFLERADGRQILHVTYGSVLMARDSDGKWLFRERIRRILLENEEEFYEAIARHIRRHIKECFTQHNKG
ncbi:hypothetical protein KEJ34_02215 [Candidatus Bathyarchaeota archaeon]|nr:hypothetical protein [Candidatus Bathyarchaeota archaeon]